MDLLGNYPGVPGLFVACVYSAALSTVSSGLNSLAAVCLKDFIQPFYKNDQLSEKRATNISKLLGKENFLADFNVILVLKNWQRKLL